MPLDEVDAGAPEVGDNLPTISVVTVTFNCLEQFKTMLKTLEQQEYPKDRIEHIIVDGGSTDGTCKFAEEHGIILVSAPEYRDNQEARRGLALRYVKNEIILYLDSDNYLPSELWLREMVRPFMDESSVVGTQSLRYAYLPDETLLNRYYALFGVNDPVPYYLNKRDRLSWAEDAFTLRGSVIKDTEGYLIVQFDEHNLPTIGCNGFLVRAAVLKALDIEPDDFMHIDVHVDAIRQGHDAYGLVKNDVIHSTGDTMLKSFRKRYFYMTVHHQREHARRRYLVFDSSDTRDVLNLLKFILYSITFIKPTYDAARGYVRVHDPAWFMHPFVCFGMCCIYSYATLINTFGGLSHGSQR